MATFILLGLGAGFVSALLFASVSVASLPAVALMYLSPLPIMIVGIGWHQLVALLALASGALVATVLVRPEAGVAFALGPALAGWGLAYLAAVPLRLVNPPETGPPPVVWRPAGHLLLWVGLAGSLMSIAALATASGGDYGRYVEALSQAASAILRREMQIDRGASLPSAMGMPGPELVGLIVALAPALLGAMLSLILAIDLWLAGRTVGISGRLPRPWPGVPGARMPLAAVGCLAAGIVLALFPGFAGAAGTALVGGLCMVFALQGLALMHFASRNRPARGLMLSVAYVMMIILGYALLPLFALLGMADTALPLRRALERPRPPSP